MSPSVFQSRVTYPTSWRACGWVSPRFPVGGGALAPRRPIARHWLGLLRHFGDDITEAVFHPERAEARLSREVAELEEQIRQKRAALRDVAKSASRVAKAGHRPPEGPAELIADSSRRP